MAAYTDIPFRDIPHQSDLFLNYLDLSPNALRFYHHAPTLEGLADASNQIADFQFPRKAIASILRRQNKSYGSDPEVFHQISELEKPDSVAIVTGQQVGIFASPLYTIYKALTAILISRELNKRGLRAVPVFWMETEDHDLQEVTHQTLLDQASSLQTVDYREALFKEAMPMRSVGKLRFSETIRMVVRDYLSHLPDSIWKPEVQSQLEYTYKPGATFTLSFAQLMQRLFRGSGLILFDPSDAETKPLVSSIFRKALSEADAINAALAQRNRELDAAGFHAQVSLQENSTVLFFFSNGERRALERHPSGFRLKNSDRAFSVEELFNGAELKPEQFSPNVLLRPLIQDHLFPTIAYVGGSSELAYFAQIEVLYKLLGRPMPVLWPRNSLTLLEPEIWDAMDRFGIEIQDCFLGRQHLMEKTLCDTGHAEAAMNMEKLHDILDRGLTDIQPEVESIALPLGRSVENARRKILHNVRRIKTQAILMGGIQNSPDLNMADRLLNHCYPNRSLQERELGIHHFFARYGPSLMEAIESAMEIQNFSHRVLRLEKQ